MGIRNARDKKESKEPFVYSFLAFEVTDFLNSLISLCLKYLLSSSSMRTKLRKYFTLNLLFTEGYEGVRSYPFK